MKMNDRTSSDRPASKGDRANCLSRVVLVVLAGLLTASPGFSEHPCTSPLVLDLDGDGVATTGLERAVRFDINGDGFENRIGWLFEEGEDAFLWLDLNRNDLVDNGAELFGTSTRNPKGEFARNGFEALAIYDRLDSGGNADGRISDADVIWNDLRLWKDRNHDAVSQPHEMSALSSSGVVSIGLGYEELHQRDGHGNVHAYRGVFSLRTEALGATFRKQMIVDDIVFVRASRHADTHGGHTHRPD